MRDASHEVRAAVARAQLERFIAARLLRGGARRASGPVVQCPWVVNPTVHLAVVVRQKGDRSPAPSAGGRGPGVGVDVARLEQAGQVMMAATVEFSCIRLQRSEAQNLVVVAGSAVQVVAATTTATRRWVIVRSVVWPICYVVKVVVVVVLSWCVVHGDKDGGYDEQGDEEADGVQGADIETYFLLYPSLFN